MEQKITNFNVVLFDFNKREFIPYDVIPYFIRVYKELKNNRPKTFDEIKDFIIKESKYQFWSRCEYEIVLQSWPMSSTEVKIDIHDQIMFNIDLVTQVFIDAIKNK